MKKQRDSNNSKHKCERREGEKVGEGRAGSHLIDDGICDIVSSRGHDASQITLTLGTAASYPRACQALGAMLSKGALNPADITVLFKMFTSMDPPPVELVSGLSF